MEPTFTACLSLGANSDGSVRAAMREQHGGHMLFTMTADALAQFTGAAKLDTARQPSKGESIHFIVEAGAVGTATDPGGQEHPCLYLDFAGGGSVRLIVPQLLLDELVRQAGMSRTPLPPLDSAPH